MLLLFDPASPEEEKRAHALSDAIARIAIGLGGTATGEHGIGLHKLSTMETEHGAGSLKVMAQIKQALDPLGILNPGKTVPSP